MNRSPRGRNGTGDEEIKRKPFETRDEEFRSWKNFQPDRDGRFEKVTS
jgi:hypothetical protein